MAGKGGRATTKALQATGKAVSTAKPVKGEGLVKKMQDTGRATDYQGVKESK